MHEQIPLTTLPNGITHERHVYTGPKGSGYIDIWTKLIDGVKYMKSTHVGVEDRPSYDWTVVDNGNI